jgi:hypothetical protein
MIVTYQKISGKSAGILLASVFASTSAQSGPLLGSDTENYTPLPTQQVMSLGRSLQNHECPQRIWQRLAADRYLAPYMLDDGLNRLSNRGVNTLLFMCHFEQAVKKPDQAAQKKRNQKFTVGPARG